MFKKVFLSSCCFILLVGAARALDPVDPDLIPEARTVLDYLESVYGKKLVSGMSSYGGWKPVKEMSGRSPAVYALDAFGWNKPTWGESYRNIVEGAIDTARKWWEEKGGIPSMQYHWGKPGDPEGSAWKGRSLSGPIEVGKVVTPGTDEHKAAMEDLRRTGDYLEQLAEARVPVLWRPFHEIDGGWFWWTDVDKPENTAALWRMMFDYYVKERKLHNLIWVYSAGLRPGDLKRGVDRETEIAYRKRFYPGDLYVDIAGIDIYPNSYYGWGAVTEDTYGKAFEIMKGVAPGKILALCEGGAIPNPDMLKEQGPPWLYSLPWFAGGQNPPEWIRKTFTHEHVLTLDELPPIGSHNVEPNVRIEQPEDGSQIAGNVVEFRAHASDRNGNLGKVEFRALAGPWKNWFLRNDKDAQEALDKAMHLGEAKAGADGSCTFIWSGAPIGLHDVVAVAHDTGGKVAVSNVVRLAIGVENLASGAKASASSKAENASQAVDGNLFTSWSSDKKQEDPTWLAVDLGSPRAVSAVVVSWWKAYAREYEIQISTDGNSWKTVFREKNKRNWHGDSDVIRFQPVKTRYVRLHATKRGTSWGGYSVYEVSVFESIPE